MSITLTSTTSKASHETGELQSLEEYLAERARERQARNTTKIVDNFPDYHDIDETAYIGVLSWTLPQRHERWIKPAAVISIGNGIQTGSEIARDYLDWKFPRKLRATKRQKDLLNIQRSAPLFVSPCVLERGSYIDLKSAYWSIMLLAGWDVDYFPGKWIVQGTIPSDFPLGDHKVARNTLVSCGLPTPVRFWTGKKLVKQYHRNVHINMGIWAFIMDTLHAIAAIARQMGAVYIHTDGYIIESYSECELIEAIEEFGLHASVKACGVSSVMGMGNYCVGSKATKTYGKGYAIHGDVDYIYMTNIEQIREKLKHLADTSCVRIRRQENRNTRQLD